MRARVRAGAGRLIRRLGLLPGGLADGLGEDDQLTDAVLTTRAAVFFPDPPENLYQIRQWYPALAALDAAMGVTILVQDSRVAATIRAETPTRVVVAGLTRTVGALLSSGDVRVVLYLGQSNSNAVALRAPSVMHVFLNHGDSDKYVSVSNQVKGFDFAFVAGQASVDRHAASLMLFDAPQRLKVVGRPQVPPRGEPSGPTTVLYAPTWEGTLAINAYSSVAAFGEELVASLLAEPDLHVIYRPHPRTGATDHAYKKADQRIRALIARHPEQARVDTDPNPAESFGQAHIAIADVSAIGTDWLAQRKPLISTVPSDPEARVAHPARIFETTPHIDAHSAADAVATVRAALADPLASAHIDELYAYYLGGMDGTTATAAFVAACGEVADLCDLERATLEDGA